MSGEHFLARYIHDDDSGLPPHARGTLTRKIAPVLHPRLTPALAGNTPVRYPAIPHPWVYPRAYGEHNQFVSRVKSAHRLPPHARGTRVSVSPPNRLSRPNPKPSGKTFVLGRAIVKLQADARMSGKHVNLPHQREVAMGSPRARGEHLEILCSSQMVGGLPPARRGTRIGGADL